MSRREARFEIVRTGPRQFHGRLVAGNGEIVWVTETYTRRHSATKAITFLRDAATQAPGLAGVNYPLVDELSTT